MVSVLALVASSFLSPIWLPLVTCMRVTRSNAQEAKDIILEIRAIVYIAFGTTRETPIGPLKAERKPKALSKLPLEKSRSREGFERRWKPSKLALVGTTNSYVTSVG